MAVKGQKFSLDLDAADFKFDVHETSPDDISAPFNVVKEIREREPTEPPPPPKLKSRTGFPEHRTRKNVSAFKQRRAAHASQDDKESGSGAPSFQPSDRAIVNHIGKKWGVDMQAEEKAQISEENKQRLANMTAGDIDEARAELMANLAPALVQRLLKRANIEEDLQSQQWNNSDGADQTLRVSGFKNSREKKKVSFEEPISPDVRSEPIEEMIPEQDAESLPVRAPATTHFPVPPRKSDAYVPLDPNSESFLSDLKTHYFPDTPHDPNVLGWLQDPTEEDKKTSPYSSERTAYAPSDIRFDFKGQLIPPSESEIISVDKGLHHHGHAPDSAGYTIPELAMLCRSTLPNQRCMAYQTLGRILFRLGRGDYGPKGTELSEGLWSCVEKERPVEVMMAEANRTGGHVSAKTHATEALWLWRKGGGGDRGILKPGERIVR